MEIDWDKIKNLEKLSQKKQALWRQVETIIRKRVSENTRFRWEWRNAHGIQCEEDLLDLIFDLKLGCEFVTDIFLSPKNNSVSTKKRYQKCLEKSLYLVSFVQDRKHGKRINWKQLSTEWNKKNPREPMTPKDFNIEYHRVKADPDVQRESGKRRYPQYAPQIEELASFTKDSSLTQERIWQQAGSIALYYGETAMSSTVEFARMIQDLPPIDKQSEVDFS